MTTSSLNIKQFPVLVVNIRVQMLCFYWIPSSSYDKEDLFFFNNFEKLSMLLGFSRDILDGWVRNCCAHVFLVLLYIHYPCLRWRVSFYRTVIIMIANKNQIF